MPELPEVETVRRGLEPAMTGRVIERADVNRPNLRWPFPEGMAQRLTGATVNGLRRRSKYILVDLDTGETLIIHLGMSGRMTISVPDKGGSDALGIFCNEHPPAQKHDHVVLHMADGPRITFNDARRFGAMDLHPTNDLEHHKLLALLGPEPLGNSFDEVYLHSVLKGKNTPIKSALLDQRIVSGLGNIYVCEALWRSGISPTRKAGAVTKPKIAILTSTIRDVLGDAIAAGGSSLQDHRQTNGELGYFQHSFAAYDREEEPCKTTGCKGKIQRITQSGRSTYYCSSCQR